MPPFRPLVDLGGCPVNHFGRLFPFQFMAIFVTFIQEKSTYEKRTEKQRHNIWGLKVGDSAPFRHTLKCMPSKKTKNSLSSLSFPHWEGPCSQPLEPGRRWNDIGRLTRDLLSRHMAAVSRNIGGPSGEPSQRPIHFGFMVIQEPTETANGGDGGRSST